MDEYNLDDELELARLSVKKREKVIAAIKRKRARQLRRQKFLLVLILGIITAGITFVAIKGGGSEVRGLESDKGQEELAADETAVEEETKETYPYANISANYVEVTDEDIDSAYGAILDVTNNEIIAGRLADSIIEPASMTKVMTLIIVLENIDDIDNTTYTFDDAILRPLVQDGASRVGYEGGETATIKDLLYGLILTSGADCAEGLAIATAGSTENFVAMMNEKASELGLKNTHFMNTWGISEDGHYTTCQEMAMIMSYVIKNETAREILGTETYTTAGTNRVPEGYYIRSTMWTRMYGTEVTGVQILGGKTGYTDTARNCLVSYASKDGNIYICVTAYGSGRYKPIFDCFNYYGRYLPASATTVDENVSESTS